MSTRLLATSTVAVAVLTFGLLGLSGPAEQPGADRLPAVQLVGSESRIRTPRFVRVRDEEAWHRVWGEHSGVEPGFSPGVRHAAPKVDFSRFMVVGCFHGERTNIDGEVAVGVSTGPEGMRIRCQTSSYQTASMAGQPEQAVKCAPFGLWVIERTDLPIIVERARQAGKSGPITWEQVMRFEPG